MKKLTLVESINQTLAYEMARDPRVVLIGEDIGRNGGVFRVTDGLQERFGEDRVVDAPLAESGIVASSIGLAMAGMRPIPEIQFEGFLGPAYDQLTAQASRARMRSRGRVTVPLTLRCPIGGGIHAPELHSDSPEAIYAHTPGLKVVIPSRPYVAKGLLLSAIRDDDPVIFFEPKRVYRSFKEEVPDEDYTIPLGVAEVLDGYEGDDITIITWGAMVHDCMKAIDLVSDQISAELIDLRTIYPVDVQTIAQSVKKTGRAMVVHEAPRSGGWGAEISALIQEQCFLYLEAPVQRVTGFDVPMPYYRLEKSYLPDPAKIAGCIRDTMMY